MLAIMLTINNHSWGENFKERNPTDEINYLLLNLKKSKKSKKSNQVFSAW